MRSIDFGNLVRMFESYTGYSASDTLQLDEEQMTNFMSAMTSSISDIVVEKPKHTEDDIFAIFEIYENLRNQHEQKGNKIFTDYYDYMLSIMDFFIDTSDDVSYAIRSFSELVMNNVVCNDAKKVIVKLVNNNANSKKKLGICIYKPKNYFSLFEKDNLKENWEEVMETTSPFTKQDSENKSEFIKYDNITTLYTSFNSYFL